MTAGPEKPRRSALPAAVVALGWVSLLTDAASDMIYPLVPAFLLSIGGGAAALGWFEGISEALGAAVKLLAGRASDRLGRRKPLIAIGYGISAAARPLLALATLPLHAVLIRAVDRVGKGLRGPPRDAMVASAVEAEQRGHAFGFHRMMDNFGGVVGPLVAAALLGVVALPLRTVFALSVVPGALSVLVVLLFVKDPLLAKLAKGAAAPLPAGAAPEPAAPDGSPARLSPGLLKYFGALALFSLAASGDLFLIRRLTDLGLAVSLVPVAWVSLQLAKGLFNVPGGRASDRYGRRRVLSLAWLLYGATYVGLGLASSWPVAWLLLGAYAVHYGLAEGGQRALLAEYAPAAIRGRAYGYQLALEGVAVLPANVLFGLAYEKVGAPVAFVAAGALAVSAAAALRWLVPSPAAPSESG